MLLISGCGSLMQEGREGREKFDSKRRKFNPDSSTTNKQKSKKKAFVMVKHKRSIRGKNKKSFREKQMSVSVSMQCDVMHCLADGLEKITAEAKEKKVAILIITKSNFETGTDKGPGAVFYYWASELMQIFISLGWTTKCTCAEGMWPSACTSYFVWGDLIL